MRYLFLLLCASCYAGELYVPAVCQRNLQFCTSMYEKSQQSYCATHGNVLCSRADWDLLCQQDLQVCKFNQGMR
jgi:hypothetical protein